MKVLGTDVWNNTLIQDGNLVVRLVFNPRTKRVWKMLVKEA